MQVLRRRMNLQQRVPTVCVVLTLPRKRSMRVLFRLQAVLEMCVSCTGLCPNVFVDAYSACGNGLDDDDTPRFPYMPHILKYIVMELLKNSCRATVDMLRAGQLHADDYPINVIVCADEDHVTICVADQARGIPRGVNAWSYLYTTAREGEYGGEKRLAGHGVGRISHQKSWCLPPSFTCFQADRLG